MIPPVASWPWQYGVLGALVLGMVVLTVVQVRIDRSVYRPYFGRLNPVAAIAAVSILGFGSLGYLMSRDWFEVVGPTDWRAGIVLALTVAPLFAAVAVGADLLLRFPRDTNVPLPDAVFFYPSMAFVVEVCLHALPFALLVALLGGWRIDADVLFWSMAIAVASIEAVFQAVTSSSRALAVFTGFHVLVFGAVQLYVFRRFGFVPMYAVRVIYYALWHVGWGWARLRLLF